MGGGGGGGVGKSVNDTKFWYFNGKNFGILIVKILVF